MDTVSLDHTHDQRAQSWVESANAADTDFPIQNLPFGIFRRAAEDEAGSVGVAIGDQILDLAGALPWLADDGGGIAAGITAGVAGTSLRPLMALAPEAWTTLRHGIFRLLLRGGSAAGHAASLLVPQASAVLSLPLRPGSFTDFFASIDHATNAGALFRPDNPLLPNYKYVPIGYHGRVSTIRESGSPIIRPSGQSCPPGQSTPVFGPSRRFDLEMELGLFLGGQSQIGEPVVIGRAGRHLFGACLLNDWSARDIQAWEYQPLGPYLGKSFGTTISTWVVTADALRPFRCPARGRHSGDPAPLPHLLDPEDQAAGALDITLEAYLRTPRTKAQRLGAHRLGSASAAQLYWTPAQLIAHQTSNGCNLEPGDLLGSGTISGAERHQLGSLLEITRNGAEPIRLQSGEERRYLEDGDEILIEGRCTREGFKSIGFGVCAGTVIGR